MPRKRLSVLYKDYLRKLLQYFLQGMVVLVPIGITVYVVILLFSFVDSILPNIIHALFPDWKEKRLPGLGFVVVVALILFVGWISSSFIVKKLVGLLDNLLEHTPGVKFIYSSVKDFLEAFAGNKRKFDHPVLVNVDAAGVWRVGFITRSDAEYFDMADHVVVYVPHSYAISGITYIVPAVNVKVLRRTSAANAMKFVISGGVAELHEGH